VIERSFPGLPPRITFTSDFHELVRGDLRPGVSVLLRYDPARIVPRSQSYAFGDPEHRIVAHVMFPPHDRVVSVRLQSPIGIRDHPDIDATGDGDMLVGSLHIADGANSMVVWFSQDGPYGPTNYDSDYGRNFHFGFPLQSVVVIEASVATERSSRRTVFALTVAAAPNICRVVVRLRTGTGLPASELYLRRTGTTIANGWVLWELDAVEVPASAAVRYKLYYWMDHIRYKDDNNGLYYMAYQGEPEQVPPPPSTLAAAAKAWG